MITPGSFDAVTAKDIVGDTRMRTIEAKARADAEAGTYDPPPTKKTGTYWSQVDSSMEVVLYAETYKKRLARLARMKAKGEMK